jgi:AbrB family looped-hinge helix DNA binding protein
MTQPIMPIAKITSKGQITIPREIRELLNLSAGDSISFMTDAEGRVTFTLASKSITSLKGIVPKPDKPVSLEDMKATIRARGASDEGH